MRIRTVSVYAAETGLGYCGFDDAGLSWPGWAQ